MLRSLVGSEMCIRDSINAEYGEVMHEMSGVDGLTEEQMVQAALEVSAKEHMQSHGGDFVMNGRFEATGNRGQRLMQLNTLDQFADDVLPSIREFQCPTATCGYFATANALALAPLAGSVQTAEDLERLADTLRDPEVIMGMTRDVMHSVSACRARWIEEHPADFPTHRSKKEYMTAWIANYEISDYLRNCGPDRTRDVVFLRYNQWPERNTATHEEKDRLEEEREFGGEKTGDKATVAMEPGASRFIVESFSPGRQLQRASEWRPSSSCPVLILDLNGHFAVALACNIDGADTLVMFNTTQGSYLAGLCPESAFTLAFRGH
eukprot:TRINITY_DN9542_c0_g1_i8.p2 TRINITY_DN9542_c0_g1~~TRINITY_DN9542_c0_g1_i8.p2  ORF type:complete len:322 (-),score=74.68 TRINITY_DN9542_c0_g1_i8:147-1112(-)